MDINKASRRDSKLNKRKNRMPVDGKSVFLIKEIQKRKSDELRRKREEKEKLLEEGLPEEILDLDLELEVSDEENIPLP